MVSHTRSPTEICECLYQGIDGHRIVHRRCNTRFIVYSSFGNKELEIGTWTELAWTRDRDTGLTIFLISYRRHYTDGGIRLWRNGYKTWTWHLKQHELRTILDWNGESLSFSHLYIWIGIGDPESKYSFTDRTLILHFLDDRLMRDLGIFCW